MTFYSQPEYTFFLYVPGRLIQHMLEEHYYDINGKKNTKRKEMMKKKTFLCCFFCGQENLKRFCLFFIEIKHIQLCSD